MIAAPICGKCSTPISAVDPDQLCQRCLMESALEFETEEPSAIEFGDYELLSEIGCGGQGIVYRARQKRLNRVVALKCIPVTQFTSNEKVERFRLEAEAAARLDHPGIVPIFEVGECHGFCFYSMKLMEGGRLDQTLKSEPIDPRAAAELLVTISRTVHCAHQRGILHRDLKPANILLDGARRPHLSDFGLARLAEQDSTLTHTLALLGTPSYMAPEQAGTSTGPREVTTAVDVYGLGAILYHLLTGSPPFAGGTTFETVRLVIEANPRRPSLLNRSVDRDLETICLKCLEKDPARRYRSADAVAEELERWLRKEPIAARPVGRVERLWRACRRKPALALLSATVGILLFVLGIGAPVAAIRINRERQLATAEAYAADMHHVQQVWAEGNLRRAQALLRSHIPKPGQRDLRGFEWRYLWNQCRDESKLSFTNFPGSVQAALSPKGDFLAAISETTLKLLDYRTGREVETFSLPIADGKFRSLAFVPGNSNMLATTADSIFLLWDLNAGKVITSITLSNPGTVLALSPNGKQFAVASDSRINLELWDLENQRQLWQRTNGMSGDVGGIAFTPDGTSICSGGGVAGNPILWDMESGTATPFPTKHTADLWALDFTKDGTHLITGANDSRVVLWDLTTRVPAERIVHPGSAINAVKLSPDGRFLLTGGDDATVRLWDFATGAQNRVFRGHRSGVNGVFFGADGRSVISSSQDGTIKVWDGVLEPPNQILQTNNSWTGSLSFSADGQKLALAAADLWTGVLSIFDVASGTRMTNLTTASKEYTGAVVRYAPNGRWLALATHDGLIRLWDAQTFALAAQVTNAFAPNSLAVSSDSRILAVAGFDNAGVPEMRNRLAFWEVASKQLLNLLPEAVPNASCVAFAQKHPLIAVGYMDGQVRIWNYETGELLADFHDQRRRIWNATFSPEDDWVAAGGNDGVVVFYDVKQQRFFRSPAETSWWVLGVAFSPDGKTLASAESDGIRLWNVFSRRSALELRGHAGIVSKVAFSPDGSLLASCGADGTIRLWHAPPPNDLR